MQMNKLIKYIKCKIFKLHVWKNLNTDPLPSYPSGTRILSSNMHQCTECGETRMLGMGWMIY